MAIGVNAKPWHRSQSPSRCPPISSSSIGTSTAPTRGIGIPHSHSYSGVGVLHARSLLGARMAYGGGVFSFAGYPGRTHSPRRSPERAGGPLMRPFRSRQPHPGGLVHSATMHFGTDTGAVENGGMDMRWAARKLSLDPLDARVQESRQHSLLAQNLRVLADERTRAHDKVVALVRLKQMTRHGAITLWDEYFKTILCMLLDFLSVDNYTWRQERTPELIVASLKLLREMCVSHAWRVRAYAELCVLRVLAAHQCVSPAAAAPVLAAASDCAATLAAHLPPIVCVRTLSPLVAAKLSASRGHAADVDGMQLNAALRMIVKVLEQLGSDEATALLIVVVPVLSAAGEHRSSSIRKLAVQALATLHRSLGPHAGHLLFQHLASWPPSKVKLLEIYIRKAASVSVDSLI